MKKYLLLPFSLLFAATARAHCPLCTAGAIAAAGGAAYFGVSQAAIGVFIGAFAVSTGWWFSRMLKKQYIPHQRLALILFSFVATIVPMLRFMDEVKPLFVFWFGDYGTFFNTTYLINIFLAGSLLGGLIVMSTPAISKKISDMRGETLPFQGLALTFALLFLSGLILEVIL